MVDPKDITVSDIIVQDENVIITFDVENPDKHFDFIGGEWSSAIFDSEIVIQCLIYKKIEILHQDENYSWSASIPLEYAEKMPVYYGNEKQNILIYENNRKTTLKEEQNE